MKGRKHDCRVAASRFAVSEVEHMIPLQGERELPSPDLDESWGRIFLPGSLKERLLATALTTLTLRGDLSSVGTAVHGLLLLTGPPGTGKTTLSRGLANEVAKLLDTSLGKVRFAEVNPHALTSDLLGQSQRAVQRLLELEIRPLAEHGSPTIILMDEVEAIAISRSSASLKANPVDVHRATDALLAGLDRLASECPRLLIIATTNFTSAVDEAFTSRADAVFQIPLPDAAAVRSIMEDTLNELGRNWPHFIDLARSEALMGVIDALAGCDGRRIRKTVIQAIGSHLGTAVDPNTVTMTDLLTSALFMREHTVNVDQDNDS